MGHLALGGRPVRADDAELVLAGPVREIGDPLAVRRPGRIPFTGGGGVGEIADVALLGRDGEQLAPRLDRGALGRGREIGIDGPLGDVPELGASSRLVVRHQHLDAVGLLVGERHDVEIAAVLEHDRVRADAGPLDVVLAEARDLAMALRVQIVGPKVGVPPAAVRAVVDRVAVPHRPLVGAHPVGDLFGRVLAEVVDPDLGRVAPLVVLPGAVVVRGRNVGDAAPVGGERGVARRGQRQQLLESAGGGHAEESAVAQDRGGARRAQ